VSFPRGLRFGGEWRIEEANDENDREPDQPHGHLDGLVTRRGLDDVD